MKYILCCLSLVVLLFAGCKKNIEGFPESKIEELKKKPVYNPPASVWKWEYGRSVYYYITADCCDRLNELYDVNGILICYPDGGITGTGDGNCPFNNFTNDSLTLKKTLIWKDDR